MVQQTFTDMEYANRNRTTKREAFLDAMESIIPWKEWMELIAPFYVQKERGRKLIPLETMLRMYLMQNWFGLSDEGIEDAIYDSYAMKRFQTFTEPHNKGVCRSQLGQEDRTRENFHPLQGGASVPHCEAAVPSGQDKVSWHQEEPAPLLSALCIGEPRHVFEGRKAEGVLHDNGISAPFFPNFPVKWAIRGRKRGNESSVARSFVLQFVKFVSADQLAVIIHYLSVIP